jgi:predicted DNA-binding protein with PD1-like motif
VDLLESLAVVCRQRSVRCGELRALGALEGVELVEYDQRAKQYRQTRRFECALEILNLTGNVSEKGGDLALHAHITVMRERDNGIEVMGGHLVRARVFACEFVIESFDDVILRRGADEATGLALWTEKHEQAAEPPEPELAAVAPAPPPPPPSFEVRVPSAADMPSSATWADVARASARRPIEEEAADEAFDVDQLRTGDLLEHPRFGRCTVERIEGEHEFAAVRLETGRLVRLALDVLRLKLARQDGERRVLQVRVQR